ncbi:hypothetical protein J6590_006789 [Homalodisca vitripennis]|nr:hypothetical protein J6590_006789 [Homalodisca vitripennis]
MACLATSGAFFECATAPGVGLDCCLNYVKENVGVRICREVVAPMRWKSFDPPWCLDLSLSRPLVVLSCWFYLKKRLNRFGILQEDQLSRMYDEQVETAEQLLFDCLEKEALRHFGGLDKGGVFPQEDLMVTFWRIVLV